MFEMSVPWWEFVVRGVVVYAFLVVLLRLTGKRQIGQLSPFDLVLLLIISNAVQNSMNAGDNSLIGGLISAASLVAINYVLALITFKSAKLEAIVEGRPQILIHHGEVFQDIMIDAKLTQQELDSTLRQLGFFNLKDVKLAILENNGKVTVQGYDIKAQK
ncbi:MAG TPA: YetF domain-containing protein [Methylotenera sp.]|nr:YetF domain-containing protein [Methylotenera sp.]